MKVIGIIPARYGAKRFPGKSLHMLGGRPLVVWVLERARQARCLDQVLVATDDRRIVETVERAGGTAVLTRDDHPSGTDRAAEAVAGLSADAVINIQGDEPLVDPGLIDRIAETFRDDEWDMATAAVPITQAGDMADPNIVKVVWDASGKALYFSRLPVPFVRDPSEDDPARLLHWRHVGLYGYRRSFLDRLVSEPPSPLEEAEKLEQLRALHIGGRIKVLTAEAMGPGVDTPADAQRAEEALRAAGLIENNENTTPCT